MTTATTFWSPGTSPAPSAFSGTLGMASLWCRSSNGTSNTALLSHLGVNSVEYGFGPTTWYNCNNATGGNSVPDNQTPLGAYLTPNTYSPSGLSSPHAGMNLVLFADGHVASIANDWLTQNQNQVWSWMNATPIQLP